MQKVTVIIFYCHNDGIHGFSARNPEKEERNNSLISEQERQWHGKQLRVDLLGTSQRRTHTYLGEGGGGVSHGKKQKQRGRQNHRRGPRGRISPPLPTICHVSPRMRQNHCQKTIHLFTNYRRHFMIWKQNFLSETCIKRAASGPLACVRLTKGVRLIQVLITCALIVDYQPHCMCSFIMYTSHNILVHIS